MKIHLVINEELETTEVHIHAKHYTTEIEQLLRKLQQDQSPTMLDGYIQQEIHMVKIDDIYSVYAEGAKVYLQTEEQEYETKRKLYELEELLAKDFVRVNKSTLVHINKIVSIQQKLGAAQLLLDNEVTIHISRKYMKQLKNQLGIGRDS